MVGGAAWMLGNLMTPFIVRCLGLGIGLSVWDLSNMFVGWATGNFGLFGVWREQVHSPVMNYTGLALAGVSLVLFAQAVEGGEEEHTDAKDAQRSGSDGAAEASPEAMEEGCGVAPESQVLDCPIDVAEKSAADSAGARLSSSAGKSASNLSVDDFRNAASRSCTIVRSMSLPKVESGSSPVSEACFPMDAEKSSCPLKDVEKSSCFPKDMEKSSICSSAHAAPKVVTSPRTFRILGFCMALLAGGLFGVNFDTATVLMQDAETSGTHSINPMDYVFSHYCGILATGVTSFMIYVMVRGELSYTPRNLVLPSILSGIMWGIAQAAWFRANVELSIVVAFPIVSSLPGIVALAWGVFYFGELKSTRSRRFATAGLLVRLPSVLLIALSNLELALLVG